MNNLLGKVNSFTTGTISEIRKCSWPGKDELFESTILVIVGMLLLGSTVAALDYLNIVAIKALTSIGR